MHPYGLCQRFFLETVLKTPARTSAVGCILKRLLISKYDRVSTNLVDSLGCSSTLGDAYRHRQRTPCPAREGTAGQGSPIKEELLHQTSRVRWHAKHGTHGVFGIVAALALCRGAPATARCHPGSAETDDSGHHRGCVIILPQVGQGSGRKVDHPAWGRTFWERSHVRRRGERVPAAPLRSQLSLLVLTGAMAHAP